MPPLDRPLCAPVPESRRRIGSLRRWLRYRPDHVATALGGGLGNQLFQFAAGRALSLRLRLSLKLDYADSLDSWGRRGNETAAFGLVHERLSDHERALWLGPGSTPWTQRRLCRWIDRALLRRRLVETGAGDPAHLRQAARPAFLCGLWQGEEFFRDHADAIRAELLAGAPSCAGSPWFRDLSAPDSVALHIRRGDYVKPDVVRTLGLCSPDYYVRATSLLRQRIPAPRFFLFTDDPEWVSAHPVLGKLGPVIPPDRDHPARDLVLMSRCRHFITANSTFSWWAAWLGQRPDSIVINPAPWFDAPPVPGRRLTPPNWLALPKN